MKTAQRSSGQRKTGQSRKGATAQTGRASEPSMGIVRKDRPSTVRKDRPSTASRSATDAFRSRRQSVQRQQGRRRLQIVVAFCAVCLAALAFIGFLNSSAFDVEEFLVQGASRASTQEIIDASGIVPGEPLLAVDIDQAVTNIEQVAWVGSAEVDRNWNGRIDIVVAERDPLIAMPTATGFALVDHWGRQLDLVETVPPNYFAVTGPKVSGEPGELIPNTAQPLLAFANLVSPVVREAMENTDVDQSGLLIALRGGGIVKMGDSTEMAEKVLALETMLASVNLVCLDTLDLRVPTAPALTRSTSAAAGDAQTDDAETGDIERSSTTESGDGEDPNVRALDC